jgi:coenzyme Q-binding protein COQ10
VLSTTVDRLLPYSAEQLFDLAADIERYPQFLPWWVSSKVHERRSGYCRVENKVAIGPIRLHFWSQAQLQRPQRIDVTSDHEPFRRFRLSWSFEPGPRGCRVELCAELALRSRFMQELLGQTLDDIAAQVICAFEARASELFKQ